MINSRAVKGAVKQAWMSKAEPVLLELRVDLDNNVVSMELPSGTKVAFDYTQLKEMIDGIEARR